VVAKEDHAVASNTKSIKNPESIASNFHKATFSTTCHFLFFRGVLCSAVKIQIQPFYLQNFCMQFHTHLVSHNTVWQFMSMHISLIFFSNALIVLILRKK